MALPVEAVDVEVDVLGTVVVSVKLSVVKSSRSFVVSVAKDAVVVAVVV